MCYDVAEPLTSGHHQSVNRLAIHIIVWVRGARHSRVPVDLIAVARDILPFLYDICEDP